ncbi:MAG TPA: polysaccharide deacetylase family protein [Gemmatimonadaceae bacterium]
MKAILTWHSIDDSGSPISVSRSVFADQVRFLASGRVRVVPLASILSAEGDAVALTFDDAFANFSDGAWPALRDVGLPATVFVVTDRVGDRNRWSGHPEPGIPDLPLADWEALGRLAAEGVEIGCHSRRHPRLNAIGDEALEDETRGGRDVLRQRLGVTASSYCYPYGAVGRRERDAVARHFERAVTTEHRLMAEVEDALLMPRLDLYYFNQRGALDGFGAPGFAARVQVRSALRRVRRLAFG